MPKKRYTIDLSFGDMDGFRTQKYTTDNPDEITFLDVFLPEFDYSWFELYDERDVTINENLIESIQKVMNASRPYLNNNPTWKYEPKEISIETSLEDIQKLVHDIVNFAFDITDWILWEYDYPGCPDMYNIEELSGVGMTLEEMIACIKLHTGKDVYLITDDENEEENDDNYDEDNDEYDDEY